MEELTLRDYPIGVLENLIGTKGKQATDRKLENYGYGFTSDGTGRKRIYTIISLPDAFHRFRSYCSFALGFPPQTDFGKLRDFVYCLFGDDDFNWRPAEMMEQYLRVSGRGMSRQTIGTYLKRLEKLDIINPYNGDFVYYKVFKKDGVQEHEIISKEEHGKAWKYYWDYRNAHPEQDSIPAYCYVRTKFGGSPRKQRRIEIQGWSKREADILYSLAADSILEEVSDE